MNTHLSGIHVAIIMDGSGRWAVRRGLPRSAGHREGARAVRHVIEAAPALGIDTLTLFAFSADNWKRPADEVASLMALFSDFIAAETDWWVAQEVQVRFIGRRDRIPSQLRRNMELAEAATKHGRRLRLCIGIDYSARESIVRAARRVNEATGISPDTFARLLAEVHHADIPEVDLLIRTGGEKRLSDFLLWECAYAELYFTDCLWPDFDASNLEAAVAEFYTRERRFGLIPDGTAV